MPVRRRFGVRATAPDAMARQLALLRRFRDLVGNRPADELEDDDPTDAAGNLRAAGEVKPTTLDLGDRGLPSRTGAQRPATWRTAPRAPLTLTDSRRYASGMAKSPGVCRFEDCRNIGQVRQLPYRPQASVALDGQPGPRLLQDLVEICGTHWPEFRAKTADRAHWLAVLQDSSLWFEAVGARS
jgi:hypothetical protein